VGAFVAADGLPATVVDSGVLARIALISAGRATVRRGEMGTGWPLKQSRVDLLGRVVGRLGRVIGRLGRSVVWFGCRIGGFTNDDRFGIGRGRLVDRLGVRCTVTILVRGLVDRLAVGRSI
jgi:hypothetical protein